MNNLDGVVPTSIQPGPGEFLLVAPWDIEEPGGVSQVVVNLYDQIETAAPDSPVLLVKSWNNAQMWSGVVDGRRIKRWRFRDPFQERHRTKGRFLFWALLPIRLAKLWTWLRTSGITVTNAHYVGLWLLPFGILRRLVGRPRVLILSVHGSDVREASDYTGIRAWLWRGLMHSADNIVACSHSLAIKVKETAPRSAGRVVTILNGIDLETLSQERVLPKRVDQILSANRSYITCVANFEHKKGQDVLLRGFASIAHKWPSVDLVLAGAKTKKLDEYQQLATELGISERVLFLTDLEHREALAVIEHALLFALPSRQESFGIVILEAGFYRIPVIATRVGGIPEIISGDEYGYLVKPDDSIALQHAIEYILHHPAEAQETVNRLHARIIEQFTWTSAVHQYLELSGCQRNR